MDAVRVLRVDDALFDVPAGADTQADRGRAAPEPPPARSGGSKAPARNAISVSSPCTCSTDDAGHDEHGGPRAGEGDGRRRGAGQMMRVADVNSDIAAIAEAEKEVTRRFRDNVMPKLWQAAAGGTSLGEKVYESLSRNARGAAEWQSLMSEEDLGRIKRILESIRRRRPPPRREAPAGKLALTFEDAVELALQKNLNLQITQLNEEALQTEIPRAKAIFYPVVGSTLTASREKKVGFTTTRSGIVLNDQPTSDISTRTPTAFISENIPTGGSVLVAGDFTRTDTNVAGDPPRQLQSRYSVSVVQPLLRGGRVYVATQPISNAEYDWRIAAAQLQAAILTVTAQTKTAYYNVGLANKVINLVQDAIVRDDALIEASDALFKAGLVTKRDLYSANLIRADDAVRLADAQGNLELAQNVLSDVLGVPIGSELRLGDDVIDVEPVPLDPVRWIALANQRRPEILAADEAVKRSVLAVRVNKNGLLPQLNFVGSYGRGETGTTAAEVLNFEGDVWTTGLVFSYPLGNVGARSLLSRSTLEHARFEQDLAQTKRQVELQVRTAVIRLRTSLERMKPLAVSVEQSEGKLEIAQARFALGQATNNDVTDAQDSLLKGQTDLLRSIVDYQIGLAELEASIAGPL